MNRGAAFKGADIIAEIKSAGVGIVASVPDIVTSDGLLWPLSRDPDIHLIRVCKEDEGVSICAALAYCDRRALLLMQNTGLFDSLNAVRAIAAEYRQPVCMMVGLQGKEPDCEPRQSKQYGVRIVEPVLDAMEVKHVLIQEADHVRRIRPAINEAYESSSPVVMLIGRSPEA